MEERFDELKTRLAEIHDLRRTLELLFWDQTVMMPPGGGPVRGQQLTTLDRIAHEKFVSDEIGALLGDLAEYEQQLDYDSDDASLIRTTRRDYDKLRRVPAELAAEMTGAAADAHDVWAKAREENDFALFLPHLERAVELKRRYIECFEGYDEPYDVLLDDFEPGMKTAEVRAVFDDLKAELVPLIAEIGSVDGDDAFMSGPWPVDAQHEYSLEIIRRFGFDESFARLDLTVHPFAASSGTQDIRLTTRYKDDDITSIFTAMHECGHGLYEHGVSPSLERTPLCHGVSSALHESQSRMWENIVGRSREFWNHFYPSFQAAFPEAVGDVDQERFYRAINRVKPSYIRVDADEATYNLHIILRFELEQEIFAGTIELKDLPDEWNRALRGVPRDPGADRHARRAPGRALVGRRLRLLPHLLARQHRLGADLGEGALGAARPAGAVRAGRVRPAARVAADTALRAGAQVHAAGDARARGRHADDRRGAVRPLPEGQAGSADGRLAGVGTGQRPLLDEAAVEDQEHDRAAEREQERRRRLAAVDRVVGVDEAEAGPRRGRRGASRRSRAGSSARA